MIGALSFAVFEMVAKGNVLAKELKDNDIRSAWCPLSA
jgi:hypothetical protein